jgi:hypothetical protein
VDFLFINEVCRGRRSPIVVDTPEARQRAF